MRWFIYNAVFYPIFHPALSVHASIYNGLGDRRAVQIVTMLSAAVVLQIF
jgi:hypothetical protein